MSRSLTPTNKPMLRIGLSKLVKRSEESDVSLVNKPKSPYTPGSKPCFRIGLSRKVKKPNELDVSTNVPSELKSGNQITPLKRYSLPKDTASDNLNKLLTSPIISETKQSRTESKNYECEETTPKSSKMTIVESECTENINNVLTPKLPKSEIVKRKRITENVTVPSLCDTSIGHNNNLSQKNSKNSIGEKEKKAEIRRKSEQRDESSDDEFSSVKLLNNKKQKSKSVKEVEVKILEINTISTKVVDTQKKNSAFNEFSERKLSSGENNETKTVIASCKIDTRKKPQKNKDNLSSDEEFIVNKISHSKKSDVKRDRSNSSRKDTKKRKLIEQIDSSSDNEPLIKFIRTEQSEPKQTLVHCEEPNNMIKSTKGSHTVKRTTSMKSRLSLKKSASSISIDSDSDDGFIMRPKTEKRPLCSSENTNSSQEENFSLEELRDEVFTLQCRVIEKENLVQQLKQSLIYRKKHDVGELGKLTQVWKIGCQEAMGDLHKNLNQNLPITMSQLLTKLNIPKDILSYDSENGSFV